MNKAWGIGGRCERSCNEEVVSARSIVQAEVGEKKKIGLCKLMNDPSAATASFLPFILVRWRSQEQRQSRGNRIGQGVERPKSAKELHQKQQGADERVLVGWGPVYLALQIAPSSCIIVVGCCREWW